MTFSYNNLDQNSGITRYNSGGTVVASTTFGYDAYGRLTELQHVTATSVNIANYTFTYNAQNNVATSARNGTVTTYTYDLAGELTGDGTSTQSYDAVGNLTGGSYSAPGPDNEMLSDGTWDYSYNADGNLVGKTELVTGGTLGWTYSYDQKNELLSATEYLNTGTGGNVVQEAEYYKYDAYGNRIETDVQQVGTTTLQVNRYALDGWNPAKGQGVGNENFDVWADLNGSGTLQARYVRGDQVDQLFAREDWNGSAFTTYWMLTDNQGSVRDVVDNNGTVQASVSYTSFGRAHDLHSLKKLNYGNGRYAALSPHLACASKSLP